MQQGAILVIKQMEEADQKKSQLSKEDLGVVVLLPELGG